MTDEKRPPWKPGDPLPEQPTADELAAIAQADAAADQAQRERNLLELAASKSGNTTFVRRGTPGGGITGHFDSNR